MTVERHCSTHIDMKYDVTELNLYEIQSPTDTGIFFFFFADIRDLKKIQYWYIDWYACIYRI